MRYLLGTPSLLPNLGYDEDGEKVIHLTSQDASRQEPDEKNFRRLLIKTTASASRVKNSERKEMTCKGICIRHKAQKPVGSGRYASGQKRCQICEIFIKWDGLWCPCCGYRLRTRPRNIKFKAAVKRAKKGADTI